jgi:hypothetical protein
MQSKGGSISQFGGLAALAGVDMGRASVGAMQFGLIYTRMFI